METARAYYLREHFNLLGVRSPTDYSCSFFLQAGTHSASEVRRVSCNAHASRLWVNYKDWSRKNCKSLSQNSPQAQDCQGVETRCSQSSGSFLSGAICGWAQQISRQAKRRRKIKIAHFGRWDNSNCRRSLFQFWREVPRDSKFKTALQRCAPWEIGS